MTFQKTKKSKLRKVNNFSYLHTFAYSLIIRSLMLLAAGNGNIDLLKHLLDEKEVPVDYTEDES